MQDFAWGTLALACLASMILNGCAPNASADFNGSDVAATSFQDFLAKCGKAYSPDESVKREENFNAAKKAILDQNEKSGSWTANLNCFADFHAAELSSMRGVPSEQRPDNGNSIAIDTSTNPDGSASFDWRDQQPSVVTEVKNQGQCGSCWAFAAAEVMETAIAIKTRTLLTLAPQQFASCDEGNGNNGCGGGWPVTAFWYAKQTGGISTTETYVYEDGDATNGNVNCLEFNQDESCRKLGGPAACMSRSCTSKCDAQKVFAAGGITDIYNIQQENNGIELMRNIQYIGPAAIIVQAPYGWSSWSGYGGDVFDSCSPNEFFADSFGQSHLHAVVLMGWGEDNGKTYWLVRNSWGAGWGEGGYIRLKRAASGTEECVDLNSQRVCGQCGLLWDVSLVNPDTAFITDQWSDQWKGR